MFKQNPFSLYDFLGYFIPGATLVYTFFIAQEFLNSQSFDFKNVLNAIENSEFHGILLIVISSYVIGHLLSFISSITIEKYGNWYYGYPSKYLLGHSAPNFFKPLRKKDWSETFFNNLKKNIWRFVICFFLLPLVLLDLTCGKLIGIKKSYENSLDDLLKNAISYKVASLVDKLNLLKDDIVGKFDPKHQDFHRIVSHYAFENCKEHQFRMVNYVALYGFLRNISLIFTLVFWITIFPNLYTINFTHSVNWELLKLLSALGILSFISFMGFMKFYRRYTLEGFMLIVVDKDL